MYSTCHTEKLAYYGNSTYDTHIGIPTSPIIIILAHKHTGPVCGNAMNELAEVSEYLGTEERTDRQTDFGTYYKVGKVIQPVIKGTPGPGHCGNWHARRRVASA